MKELVIGFGKQGYIVTFGLMLNTIDEIKKQFPKAKPIKRVTVGYEDIENTLEPYKEQVKDYILPLLTGLKKSELKQFEKILVVDRAKNHKYLTITHPHVEEV